MLVYIWAVDKKKTIWKIIGRSVAHRFTVSMNRNWLCMFIRPHADLVFSFISPLRISTLIRACSWHKTHETDKTKQKFNNKGLKWRKERKKQLQWFIVDTIFFTLQFIFRAMLCAFGIEQFHSAKRSHEIHYIHILALIRLFHNTIFREFHSQSHFSFRQINRNVITEMFNNEIAQDIIHIDNCNSIIKAWVPKSKICCFVFVFLSR